MPCARQLAHHLLDRAPVVDVQHFGFCRLDDLRGPHHGIQFGAEDLHADGAFVVNIEFLKAFMGVADQAFHRNELGIKHVAAVLLAQRAEGRVAHVLHGGEQQGEFT